MAPVDQNVFNDILYSEKSALVEMAIEAWKLLKIAQNILFSSHTNYLVSEISPHNTGKSPMFHTHLYLTFNINVVPSKF